MKSKLILPVLVFLVLFLEAASLMAAPTRLRSATGSTGAAAATSVAVTVLTPTNGNTLVAVISTRGTTASRVSSVSQTGATWTRAVQAVNTNGDTTEIWYAPGVSGAGTAVTINLAASMFAAAVVAEYSGVWTTNTLDATSSATNNGTAAVTGTTATTSQADELWVGGIGLNSSTPTVGTILNGFASVANAASTSGTAGNNAKVYALDRITNAVAAASSGGTISATAQWSGAIATFVAAPAVSSLDGWVNLTNNLSPGTIGYTNTTSATFTVSDSPDGNKLLLVGVSLETAANATISSIEARLDSASGAVFTNIVNSTGSQRMHSYLGYLKASQVTAGSHAIYLKVTLSGSTISGLDIDVGTYEGVDQTSPISSSAANNSAALTVTFGTAVSYGAGDATVYMTGLGNTATAIANVAGFNGVLSNWTAASSSTIAEVTTNTMAGSYASGSTVTWTGGSTRASIAVVSLNADSKHTPNVTAWPTASAITYGQSVSNSTLTGGTAGTAGTFAFTTPSLTPNAAGATNVNVTFTPTDTVNYNTATADVSLTVNALAVVLTGTRAYDGTTEAAGTDLTVSNALGGDVVTLTGSGTLAGKDVGTQTITAAGTPLRVQSATGAVGASAATSFAVTVATPQNGNTLVAVISTRRTSASAVSSITQTGVTWSRAAQSAGTAGSTTEIWYGTNVSSAGTTVTVNLAASLFASAVVMEYQGLLAVSSVDVTANSSGNSTAAVTGTTGTTTQGNELWIGGIGFTNSGFTLGTPSSSFTAVTNVASGSASANLNARVYALEKIVTTTGTAASGGTLSTSAQWSGAIVTFKAVSLGLSGADAGNYTLTGLSGAMTITNKTLTMTGLAASNKIYDGTTNVTLTGTAALLAVEAVGTGTTADGKPYTGDTVTIGGTPAGSFADANVGNSKTVTVTGNTLSGAQAGNYTLTQQTGITANITAKALTLTGTTSVTAKTYDGTNTATLTGSTLQTSEPVGSGTTSDGIPYTGDTVTLTLSGTFSDKNIGTSKVVTSTSSLSGAQSGNYTLTQPTGLTGDITTKALTLTATPSVTTKNYNGTNTATLTGSALQTSETVGTGTSVDGKYYTGDTVTLTLSGTFADRNVGASKAVTSTSTLGGAQAGNYTLTQPIGLTGNINTTNITVTATTNTKTYDQTNTAAAIPTVTSGSIQTGDTASYTESYTNTLVGTSKPLVPTGVVNDGNGGSNYNVTLANNNTGVINALALTVTGITASNKVYDRTNTATIDTSGAVLGAGVIAPDDATLVTSGAIGRFANSNVANNITVTVTNLTLTGADAGNYSITPPTTTANITALSVSITNGLAGVSRIYNGTNTATITSNGVALSGVIAGDTVTAPTNGYVATFADKNIGTSKSLTITGLALGGAKATNYSLIQPTNLTADITAKALTMSGLTAGAKVYDGTTNEPLGGTAALQTAEAVGTGTTADGKPYTGDGVTIGGTPAGSFADANVGNSKPVTVTGNTLSGTFATNYTLTQQTGLTANITKATPVVTDWPTASDITYGQTLSNSTLTGGSATPAGSFGWTTPSTVPNAGTNAQSVTYTPTDTANYNTTNSTINVIVAKANPTVTVTGTTTFTDNGTPQGPSTATTGGSTGTLTFSYSGTGATAYGPSATQPSFAGTFSVTASVTADANYNAASSSATAFTINNATAVQTVTFTTAGSNSWTAPAGVTEISVEVWGGGGGGGGDNSAFNNGAGGGGGGAYAKLNTYTVTPGSPYSYFVGGGGGGGSTSAGNGVTGTNSFFVNTNTLNAAGGTGGTGGNSGAGGGGGATGATGDVKFSGGGGATGTGTGGGGGGSGGTATNGNTVAVQTGATAVTGGGPGGNGGSSSAGSAPASGPGGGGGGADENFTAVAGGAGFTGQVRISYKLAATVTLSNLTQTYTGGSLTPTATTVPTGLTIVWTSAPQTNAGTYSVTATINDPGYQGSTNGSFVISKQTPLVSTNFSATTITFGQTLASSTLSGALTNAAGQSVGGVFTFESPGIAPDAGITNVSVIFTPTDTTDYNNVTNTVTVTVNANTPVLTLTASAITYGQTLASSSLSGSAATNALNNAAVAGTFAFADNAIAPNAGSTNVSVIFTPTDTANYNNATNTVTVTVNKQTPLVSTAFSGSAITFGQTLASSTPSGALTNAAGASVPGTFAFASPGIVPNAPSTNVSVIFTPTDTTDYNNVTNTVTVTVNKQTPLVSTAFSGSAITYGQTLASSTPGGALTNAAGASVPGVFTFESPGIAPDAGITNVSVIFTPTDTTDYNNVTNTVTVTVNANTPVLTLTASAITYGQTLASSSLSGSAATNALNNAAVAGTFVFADDGIAPNAGSTNVSVIFTPTDTANYNNATNTVSVIVHTVELVGGIGVDNKVYDGDTGATVTNYTLTGVINSDDVGLTNAGVAHFADKNVGTNKTVIATNLTLTGSAAGNYALVSASATNTADITVRTLTVTATGINKVYDGNTNATVNLSDDKVGGDDVTDHYTSASFADANAGTNKPVSVAGISLSGADAGNYSFNDTAATVADITAAGLTGGIGVDNKVYDGDTGATVTNYTLTGVINSDDVGLTNAGVAHFADKNVGTNKTVIATNLTLTGSAAGNYALVSASATNTADITVRTLTVSATGINKVYDGNTNATVNLSDDKVGGDDVTDHYTSASFADANAGTNKPVSVAGISLSGADAGNYSFNDTAATVADITAAGLTGGIGVDNKVYDGDTGATVTNYTLTGVINSDDVGLTNAGVAHFADKNVGTNKTVIATNLTLTGSAAGNYALVSASATNTADITVRTLTVSATGINKVYDGNTNATVNLSDDKVGGDDVTDHYTSASFADANAGTNKPVSVAGISLSGADAGNYSFNDTAATVADITAAGLTGGIGVDNKVYDGDTGATVTNYTLTGVINSDDVGLTNAGVAHFADKNVGTNKTVIATNLTLTGSAAGNYALVSASATNTADITVRTLTVTATGINKVYDGNTNATVNLSDDKVGGDDVTDHYTSASFADANAGTNKPVSVAGISLSGADAGNYSFNDTAATVADITVRTLTVTATGINKVYDGNTNATVNLSDDKVGGDDVTDHYTSASFADANAGTNKPVSVAGISLSGADAGNYSFNDTAATVADITAAGLTGGIGVDNKVYDGDTGATVTNYTLTGVINSDDVGLTNAGVAHFADKNVGTNKTVIATNLTLTGSAAGNYALVSASATNTADITVRTLTVTATGINKVYDGNTNATVNLSDDKVGGDDVTDHYTSASFADANAGTNKPVSVAGISLSGADAGNYSFNDTAATVADITVRTLTVTATGINKVYDGNTNATVNLSDDKVGGDDVTDHYTSASFADANAGTNKPVSVAGISLSGADAGNYSFNDTAATVADITAAGLTGGIGVDNKVYDGDTGATVTNYTLTGVINSDDVGLTNAGVAHFADKNVGTNKTVIATNLTLTGSAAGNYALVSASATNTADITVRTLTVSATGINKVYDGNTNATVNLSDDKVGGDDVTDHYTSASFADANAGTNKPVSVAGISLSGADAGNYSFNDTAATVADITAAGLTGGIGVDNKVYDGDTGATVTNYTLTGVINSDDVGLTNAGVAHFADKNVGTNKTVIATNLTLTGSAAGNYALVSASATNTADITVRTLTVTATGINKVYDGNTNATVNLSDDKVGGDDVTDHYTSASFADANAGTNKPVSVAGISLSGADAGNYTLASTTASTTANIAACPTISLSDLTQATNGLGYTNVMTASGGVPSYTFGVVGTLPGGLSLSGDGVLSGVVTGNVGLYPFTVTASDTNGCMGSSNYWFAVAPVTDTDTPKVKINAPTKVFGDTNNPPLVVGGTASDKGLLTKVLLSLDDGDATNLATFTGSSGINTNWAYNWVGATSGVHTVTAKAYDSAGHTMLSSAYKFTYHVYTPVTVTIVGQGTLSTGWTNGQNSPMVVNALFKNAKTVAASGWLYQQTVMSWDGQGPLTNTTSKFNVMIHTNLNLTVYFVTNKYLALNKVSYYGLFSEAGGVAQPSAGLISVKIGAKDLKPATFTTKVFAGGYQLSGSGVFDVESGVGTTVGARKPVGSSKTTNTVVVQVQLPLDGTNATMSGQVSNNLAGGWMSPLAAGMAVTDTNYDGAGRYTLVIPGTNAPVIGDGYGLVTIDTGVIKLSGGKLADGNASKQKVNVTAGGYWPLFVPGDVDLNKAYQSLLLGWVTVGGSTNGLDATYTNLVWIKKGAFTNQVPLLASPYNPAVAPVIPLRAGDGLGEVTYYGTSTLGDYTTNVGIALDSKFYDETSGKVKTSKLVKVVTKTGKLQGALADDVDKVMEGAVLQNANIGRGFYMIKGGTNSAEFQLNPLSPAPGRNAQDDTKNPGP